MTTHNHDVVFYHNELTRYIEEAALSQSANLADTRSADMSRLNDYLTRYDQIMSVMQGLPEVDSPETHPDAYELEDTPAVVRVENERINMFIRILDIARRELRNSASSRAPSGLIDPDETRQRSYILKAQQILNMTIQPADFPESSPRTQGIVDGRTGINPGS